MGEFESLLSSELNWFKARAGMLSLRALTAIGARCARRVEPLFGRDSLEPMMHSTQLTLAISYAEAFCKGDDASSYLVEAIGDAEKAVEHAKSVLATYVGRVALHAAKTARVAEHLSELAVIREVQLELIVTHVHAASCGSDAAYIAASASPRAASGNKTPTDADLINGLKSVHRIETAVAMQSDLQRLLAMDLGAFPCPGKEIDATREGPLGALWPSGSPQFPSENSTRVADAQDLSAPKLFFSYSHKDEPLRDKLETHLSILKRNGVISSWYDRAIGPGNEIDPEIRKHLQQADIILLLVSPDFLASHFCWDVEVQEAVKRHRCASARVIPVILRPCHGWQESPFGNLKALPTDGKASGQMNLTRIEVS